MDARSVPNILLLCTDQQRWDTLGCYGNAQAHTPALDAFAAEGAVFEQCYVQNPICSPSRASLFTGLYARNHGLWANGVALPDHRRMFTRVLANAGYDCGMIGKQHLSPCEGRQIENRFDDGFRVFEWAHDPIHRSPQNAYHRWLRDKHPSLYDGLIPREGDPRGAEAGNKAKGATPANTVSANAHFSHWVAERAIAFIGDVERDDGQPFFLIANFFDPHHPFGAPEEFRALIDGDAIPPPIREEGELDRKPDVQRAYSKKSYGGHAPGFAEYTPEEIREIRASYYAMVALVDHEVGRVLSALEERGLSENTLVVFTSDHGEMLGDHDILLKGPMMYDACTRVPLLARWPGRIPAGLRVPNIVQWIDLPATFLDVAGASGADLGQGDSLMSLVRGETDWRNWALCEYRDSGHQADPAVHTTMLRQDQYKLVIWHGIPATARETDGELYDLAADPGELNNLYHSPAHRDLRESLKDQLLNVLDATEDRSQPRVSNW
ncbi:MAG: sulfatase-like hydrolase/transferase [Albidovulum sp.]|nr:sulfatase-like hydrolase/transferase [Albidovulum sp.]MDE0303821.1 sulfatase-like hydrolase/transferase [Albidovulum sp.]MDE0532743.1 sulfatase-like hydrolase/transferase [Albidovulum sp.]